MRMFREFSAVVAVAVAVAVAAWAAPPLKTVVRENLVRLTGSRT